MNRNQFTFYKSFDDTFDILDDKQTLKYLKTLRDVQFLRVRIQDVSFDDKLLNGIWQSTKHTLSTSIKGYLDSQLSSKVSNPFFGCYDGYSKDEDPFLPPSDTPSLGGQMQVKGKGENKVEDKEEEKYEELLDFLNSTVGKKYRTISSAVKSAINARLKEGFTFDDFKTAITNASKDKYHRDNNYQWLTLEYISRPDQFEKWLNVSVKVEPTPIVLSKEQELKEIEEWIANPDNHEFKGTDPYDTDRVKVFLTHTAGNLGHDLLKKKLKRHLELTERL